MNFYVTDFYLKSSKKWLTPEFYFEFSNVDTVVDKLNKKSVSNFHKWVQPSFETYKENLSQVSKSISDGFIKKLVPVVREFSCSTISEQERENNFFQFLNSKKAVYPYGIWAKNQTGMMGITPEIFLNFSINGSNFNVKTVALAGTTGLHSKKNFLLNQTKDLKEHGIVVNSILESLKGFGSLSLGETKEVAYESLRHLKTKICLKGFVNEEPIKIILSLILKLHPTPALGGFPKNTSLSMLKKIEASMDRGCFGAPFGVLDEEFNFNSIVAIRNLIWNQKESYIHSGAGIVSDSVLENEWKELQLKRNTIKRQFGFEKL